MKRPSSDWATRLVLLIQECHAETGMEFGEFLGEAFQGLKMDADSVALVKSLKETLEST
jgi:hypothetical protein